MHNDLDIQEEYNVGFKTKNEFCLRLEDIKIEQSFDTYIETIAWYYENEADIEMEKLVKSLNSKILQAIEYEAMNNRLLRERVDLVRLF